jgi:hypothetical protein
MLRLSIFGWSVCLMLLICLTEGLSAWGQVQVNVLNPRGCVVDETVPDTCPTVAETRCPTGRCRSLFFVGGAGCRPDDGTPAAGIERTPLNSGAVVQAAREAGPAEEGRRPADPPPPVICYEWRPCWCKVVDPVTFRRECGSGTTFQEAIVSWKPGKFLCVGAEPLQ